MSQVNLPELESEIERIANAYSIHSTHIRRGNRAYWFIFCPHDSPLFMDFVAVNSTCRRDVDRIIADSVKRWELEKASAAA